MGYKYIQPVSSRGKVRPFPSTKIRDNLLGGGDGINREAVSMGLGDALGSSISTPIYPPNTPSMLLTDDPNVIRLTWYPYNASWANVPTLGFVVYRYGKTTKQWYEISSKPYLPYDGDRTYFFDVNVPSEDSDFYAATVRGRGPGSPLWDVGFPGLLLITIKMPYTVEPRIKALQLGVGGYDTPLVGGDYGYLSFVNRRPVQMFPYEPTNWTLALGDGLLDPATALVSWYTTRPPNKSLSNVANVDPGMPVDNSPAGGQSLGDSSGVGVSLSFKGYGQVVITV